VANPLIRAIALGTFPFPSGPPDLSGFTITPPGEQEAGVPFNLLITNATDEEGDPLAGSIAVTVVSNDDGTVFDDNVTFTDGDATITGIDLTTVDEQTLTVTIAGVTNSKQVQVDVVAPDLSGFTITDPGTQEPATPFNLGLTDATDFAGDALAGAIAVTVDSDIDGEVYSDSPTFTAGAATLSSITLTEAQHILTVTVTGVTEPEAIGVTAGTQTAATFLLSLNPDGYWPLGEESGDALDLSGNENDGTVTLGSGTRATAALDDQGDGSLTFAASGSNVSVPADAAINNIWAGGGGVFVLVNPAASATCVVVSKTVNSTNGWTLFRTSTGLLEFAIDFSGTNGAWDTSAGAIVASEVNFVCVLYDSSSASNNPTIIVWNPTNGTVTYTVGSGLTEVTTPVGSVVTDAAIAFGVNNFIGSIQIIDEPAVFNGSQPTQQQIEDYIALAAGL
jgi:hypothetical protein